jgi:alpha-2-macroglobulin-like protein
MYGAGESASVETSGLATQALLKWGQAPAQVRKALAFLYEKKQSSGNWGTTQATIMALRALLMATQLSASDVHGTVTITVNHKPVQTLNLNGENNDLLHQFVVKDIDPTNASNVELKMDGKGSLAYQVVGRTFVPWQAEAAGEALSIDVHYDRTHFVEDDVATATATVGNNLKESANMVMVDLGIPPGFELQTEDLQAYQEKSTGARNGKLEKFSLTATQAILYFNALGPGQTVTLSYRLRAKYPIRARTFESKVYEYYEPEIKATVQPVELEVTRRK